MNNKIKIKIKCRNNKRFIEELIRNHINLHNIDIKDNNIYIIIDKEDYKKIDSIKLIHDIKIVNYYGINKIKYIIKKYKVLLFSAFIGILANILLSNIIFNIEVKTNNKNLEKAIISDLKKMGLKKYTLKKTFNQKSKIKEQLLKKENKKIEWLEIEEHGTKYIIKVEPRKVNNQEEKCKPRNIIAKKNAVITKINSSEGEISKKENDYVQKGEVLISGLIHNKDIIVSKRCSKGQVLGETWYKVKIEFPKNINIKQETNKKSYGISINFFKNSINLNHKFPNYHKNEYNIVGSKFLPLSLSLAKYQEIIINKEKYNYKSIDKKALQESEKELKKHLNKYSKILSKKILKKELKNSKIIVYTFISIEEDITAYQDITSVNIEKINEENKKKE